MIMCIILVIGSMILLLIIYHSGWMFHLRFRCFPFWCKDSVQGHLPWWVNWDSVSRWVFTCSSTSFFVLIVLTILWLGEGGYVVCYEMADIERKLGFGRNSLVILFWLIHVLLWHYAFSNFTTTKREVLWMGYIWISVCGTAGTNCCKI